MQTTPLSLPLACLTTGRFFVLAVHPPLSARTPGWEDPTQTIVRFAAGLMKNGSSLSQSRNSILISSSSPILSSCENFQSYRHLSPRFLPPPTGGGEQSHTFQVQFAQEKGRQAHPRLRCSFLFVSPAHWKYANDPARPQGNDKSGRLHSCPPRWSGD